MPGSSHILGFMLCSNKHALFTDKPRSLTFDAKFVIGFDRDGNVQTATAVMNYFLSTSEETFVDGALYYVTGKVASIDAAFAVVTVLKRAATTLSSMWNVLHCRRCASSFPIEHFFSLAFALLHHDVGTKTCDREFIFDVRNSDSGTQRVAGHLCNLPVTNARFVANPPLPAKGKITQIVGNICRHSVGALGDDNVKCVVVEVNDITFIGSDFVPSSPNNVAG